MKKAAKIVSGDYKPSAYGKWSEIVTVMKPHTQGASPIDLFTKRQPNESSDPNALNYRLENHRSITKDDFDIAIDQYINSALKLEYTQRLPDSTSAYIQTLKLVDGYKTTDLLNWTMNYVGRYRQSDPNAFVVVMPLHPESMLIPSYEYIDELPNFDLVTNQNVKPRPWLIPSKDIYYLDESSIVFSAGSWLIDEEGTTKAYYFAIEKSQITLVYPRKKNGATEYVEYPWYNTESSDIDAFVIGGKLVLDTDDDGNEIQYYLPDYWGAAQWGNQAYCQLSDLQICEKRFTYPEKVIVAKDCEHIGSYMDDYGKHMFTDVDGNTSLCPSCAGKGYLIDTSPLGTHIVRQGSGLDADNRIIDPVKYVTPDTAILEHSANRVDAYYDKMMDKLFITKQNMTNQSGEAKMYDSEQKRRVNSNIVRDLFQLYNNICKSIARLLGNDPNDVELILPDEIDVINANDALVELQGAKTSGVSYPVVVEKAKQHLLKVIGNTPQYRLLVDFLAKNDKLFGYSNAEIKDAIAVFGSGITDRDKAIHYFGYTILKDWVDKQTDEITEDRLTTAFSTLILPYIVPTNTL